MSKTMSPQYRPLPVAEESTESSNDFEKLRDEQSYEVNSRIIEQSLRRGGSRIWLIHCVLLLVSFTLFSSAYFTRLSTLRHVKQFSAYCR